jgi:membrane-associated phospholipid phosphatase
VLTLLPRLAPVIGVLTIGLALGAIYGGFHYAIDALAGAVLGTIVYLLARPLYARLARVLAGPPSPA